MTVEVTDLIMTFLTGGILVSILRLSYKVGHLEGSLTQVVTTCKYLNHRTTGIEEKLSRIMESGSVTMISPAIDYSTAGKLADSYEGDADGHIDNPPSFLRRLRRRLGRIKYRSKGGENHGRKRRESRERHRNNRT